MGGEGRGGGRWPKRGGRGVEEGEREKGEGGWDYKIANPIGLRLPSWVYVSFDSLQYAKTEGESL